MKLLPLAGFMLVVVFTLVMQQRMVLPRGIRNNNPGNIRRTTDQWEGMSAVQSDSLYVQFEDPKYGFRAMTRVLRSYQRRGLHNVRDIISRWAPESENVTENYIAFVSQQLGVAPE